jgi:hypothetical protein
MFELLHVTPWNRFPLVIHWLTQVRRGLCCVCEAFDSQANQLSSDVLCRARVQEYHQLLDGCPPPPRHMKVNIGSLAQIEHLYKSNANAQGALVAAFPR